MKSKFSVRVLCLSFLFVPAPAQAQTVNGSSDAVFAVGKWKESHEGVSLFCARITTQKEVVKGNSNGVCLLTEAQATAKDSVKMSTNMFVVTSWDEHGLSATTGFYADKNGDETSESSPGAIKIVFRLVIGFDKHELTKFVEASTGTTRGYHLESQ